MEVARLTQEVSKLFQCDPSRYITSGSFHLRLSQDRTHLRTRICPFLPGSHYICYCLIYHPLPLTWMLLALDPRRLRWPTDYTIDYLQKENHGTDKWELPGFLTFGLSHYLVRRESHHVE